MKVQGINDGVYGYDKTFTMTISNPQGASFAANATTSETGHDHRVVGAAGDRLPDRLRLGHRRSRALDPAAHLVCEPDPGDGHLDDGQRDGDRR